MAWLFQPVGLNPELQWWSFIGFCVGMMFLGYGILGAIFGCPK